MISLDRVTFRYQDAAEPAVRTGAVFQDVSLTIPEGELCLVVGGTGSGKSTLLQLLNGLVPHFTGGQLTGTVTVGGLDTRTHPPRDLADIVGVVGQDPLSGFVTDRVDDELAYSMEQLGVPAPVMRQRVEEIIDLLGLARIRHRSLSTLSAGEQQRVAIGAALTAQPRVLVLDEPTSALDPSAAEEVLAALVRLVHDLGVTVVLAEHRLERVIQYADSMVLLDGNGSVRYGTPATILASSTAGPGAATSNTLAPPIIELGRLSGWEPLPLSIRDARRMAQSLRERLGDVPGGRLGHGSGDVPCDVPGDLPGDRARDRSETPTSRERNPDRAVALRHVTLRADKLSVHYGRVIAVEGVDLQLHVGEITALMGRNGSGKSSLLWALQGSGPRSGGTVRVAATANTADTASLSPRDAIRYVVLVPQRPSDLLYLETVEAECREADRVAGCPHGTTSEILERLSPGLTAGTHPRDLSEGQRLALALAVQLASDPSVILLDEPTRGLDYAAKTRLCTVLTERVLGGASVLLSSHDVEFVARTANRVVVLSEGEVITDGPAETVLTASATFAPQVSRILRPLPFLTVDAVKNALAVQP